MISRRHAAAAGKSAPEKLIPTVGIKPTVGMLCELPAASPWDDLKTGNPSEMLVPSCQP
jgi:hypothetical protein